jgi:hypothetical protein
LRYISSVTKTNLVCLLLLFSVISVANPAFAGASKYIRIENKEDVRTKPAAGIAMMGGAAISTRHLPGCAIGELRAWVEGNAGRVGD